MAHYLLTYHVAADYLERRGEFRAEHLALAWISAGRGELVLGGALEDPVDVACLLFASEGPEVAQAFAQSDPYVREGLVERWSVRRWNTVVGELAADPVRP